MRRTVAVLVTAAAVLGLTVAATAAVVGPSPVKNGDLNEQNPAASENWFAWTQRPTAHPNRPNVFAEALPIDGADAFRVNPTGTRGWAGGLDGDTFVYQEIESGQSSIRLYDLATKSPLAAPPINSSQWEWHPTISTDSTGDQWIEFGRQNPRTGVERILMHNVTDGVTRELQRVRRAAYTLLPGQVSGDWATWTACNPRCNVRFVNLLAGSPMRVPRPASVRHQYASSITDDGTVYFVKSGRGCGVSVRILRYRAGTRSVLVELAAGRDIFITHTSEEADGNHVYYDRVVCSKGRWNIYKIVDAP